jgi:hypothetical protein
MCPPPLAFGLGTASQNFSAEKFCSGVQLPTNKAKRRMGYFRRIILITSRKYPILLFAGAR